MRIKSVWRAGVLAALAALAVLAPGKTLAQESWPQGGFATGYAPPAVQLPYPLYSTHPEAGGLFVAASYVMYNQTNPLRGQSQAIAYRGFVATDDTVLNAPGTAGTFIGNRNVALDTNQVSGPYSFEPGFQLEVGWKFGDGSALTASFWWIAESQYSAAATLAAPNYQYRSDQAQTYLTSFVYNFPADFAGAPNKVTNPQGTAGPYSVYGIWNGASVMTEVMWQRAEQFYMTYRKPFYETDCYRASALVGPKWFWIEDKFRWITTDLDVFGDSSPIYQGVYNNQVDNRMYGLYAGLQQEWYLGWGFAAMLNMNVAGYLDVVKTMVDYQRGDRGGPEHKRTREMLQPVPEFQLTPSIMWYPMEGIQLQFSYDWFAFLNTVASQQPVDFNYSSLTPAYNNVARFFNGFQATIAFIF
ncbi:MAG: hypothetical protein ACYC3I_07655 [Gemmataceae bacterium]